MFYYNGVLGFNPLRFKFRKTEAQGKVTWIRIYTEKITNVGQNHTDIIVYMWHTYRYISIYSVARVYGLLFLDKIVFLFY